MTIINARERYRNARTVAAPKHKFDVGVCVSYRSMGGVGTYSVTRQLPDGGQGLQYRVRSDRDGQERVAVESALERTIS